MNHTVFVGSTDNYVHAIDSTSGLKRWSAQPKDQINPGQFAYSSPVLSPDGATVYIGNNIPAFGTSCPHPASWGCPGGRSMYALDAASGKARWTSGTYGNVGSAALSPDGNTLFFPYEVYQSQARRRQ